MKRRNSFVLQLASLAFSFSITAIPASASFIINATFGSDIQGDKNASTIESTINAVIANYETMITTSISINVTFGEMSSGLGQSSIYTYAIPYSSYISALFAHASSADDFTAISKLSQTATLDPVDSQSSIQMTGANAKALGLGTFSVTHAASEATVSLNTSIMNLSRTGTQNSNYYDLQGVVSHELDEVLGLGSSLGTTKSFSSPEDLFRYAANGSGGTCSSVKNRSYSASAAACFSIDGTTGLAQFNNTASGDTGDWLTPVKAASVQIQDANGTTGTQPNLGVELRALDVIGYDLAPAYQYTVASQSSQSAAPEPGSVALAALALAGMAIKRRKF